VFIYRPQKYDLTAANSSLTQSELVKQIISAA
jgi:hypothetical protein